jgi:hypothetical protein
MLSRQGARRLRNGRAKGVRTWFWWSCGRGGATFLKLFESRAVSSPHLVERRKQKATPRTVSMAPRRVPVPEVYSERKLQSGAVRGTWPRVLHPRRPQPKQQRCQHSSLDLRRFALSRRQKAEAASLQYK